MKVQYDGPFKSVQIAATGQTVARGGIAEVPAAVGRELVKQSVWAKVTTKKASNKEKESSET